MFFSNYVFVLSLTLALNFGLKWKGNLCISNDDLCELCEGCDLCNLCNLCERCDLCVFSEKKEWCVVGIVQPPSLFYFVFCYLFFLKLFFKTPQNLSLTLNLVDTTSFFFFGLLDNTMNMKVIRAIAEKRGEWQRNASFFHCSVLLEWWLMLLQREEGLKKGKRATHIRKWQQGHLLGASSILATTIAVL